MIGFSQRAGTWSKNAQAHILEFSLEKQGVPVHYCTSIAKVIEVIELPEQISRVNAEDELLHGIINVRKHKFIPLYNLAHKLNMDPIINPKTAKIIVTYLNGKVSAILVNQVRYIHSVQWEDIQQAGKDDAEVVPYTLGYLTLEDRIVQLLDIDAIVNEEKYSKEVESLSSEIRIPIQKYKVKRSFKHVFFVDDSSIARNYIRNVFTYIGYNITIFESGAQLLQAMAVLSTGNPDIVVCDLEMAGISGELVIETVRKNHDYNSIPIIILSTAGHQFSDERLLHLGVAAVFSKSEVPQLVAAIDEILINKNNKNISILEGNTDEKY